MNELNRVSSLNYRSLKKRDEDELKQKNTALQNYFGGSNSELFSVVEKLKSVDHIDDSDENIMKLVIAVHQKFKWSPTDVYNYIRSTKASLSDTFKTIGDLQRFVEKNLIASNDPSVELILLLQNLSRDRENVFKIDILQEMFNFKKYLEDNWKMKPNDVTEYIKQMKTETKHMELYASIITEEHLSKQDVENIKETSKKLKCDFMYRFFLVFVLKQISENSYNKILSNFSDKTKDKYSISYLKEFTKYYEMQQPKMEDETLKSLADDGAKNTELDPKLLARIYKWATKHKLSPDSLVYYFRKNVSRSTFYFQSVAYISTVLCF